jgi:hypothetical protein
LPPEPASDRLRDSRAASRESSCNITIVRYRITVSNRIGVQAGLGAVSGAVDGCGRMTLLVMVRAQV